MNLNESTQFQETEIGLIPKDWMVETVGNIAEQITKGSTPTTYGFKYQDSGVNFIKVESIAKNGEFIPAQFAYITEENHASFKRSQLREYDILYSIAGALGRVAIVSRNILPANTNQALAIIRLSSLENTDLKYVYYSLQSNHIATHISKINVSTAQANLSLSNIGQFKIPLPPLAEQIRIGECLSKMDERIRVVEEQIETVEKLKKGLMQQLLTRGIGHTEFVDHPEFGAIPKAWKVVELADICSPRKQKGETSNGTPCIELEHINQGSGTINGYDDSGNQTSTKNVFLANDVLFGKLRPYLRKYWLAEFDGLCTTEALVLIANPKTTSQFLFQLIQSDSFIDHANSMSYGTKMPRTSWNEISVYKIPLPLIAEQIQIGNILGLVDSKIASLKNRITSLSELKTALMNDLLTGRKRLLEVR